jgi:hypothetical protein
MRISPDAGCSSPATARKVVVLPQPDGPSSVSCSPGKTLKLNPAHRGNMPEIHHKVIDFDVRFRR